MNIPQFRDLFDTSQEKNQPPKHTAFDLLTRLILPLVLVIIAQLQEQSARFWGLLVFAFVSLVIGLYRPVKEQIRYRINKFRDERLAKRRFPEFKRFVHRFGEFVDRARSDTLHHIALQELCCGNQTDFHRLGVTALPLFNGFLYHFRTRVDKQQPNLTALLESTSEFSNLVSSYAQYCTIPIFERFPQELRPLLTERAKSSLNSFQQQFAGFLDIYTEFLKNLDDSLTIPRVRSYYFPRPKPF